MKAEVSENLVQREPVDKVLFLKCHLELKITYRSGCRDLHLH